MNAQAPKRIPVPLAQRWRDVRLRVMPIVVFGAALVGMVALWKEYVAAPSMLGQAEPVLSNVTSQKPGILAQLNVERFQKVKAGDTIGQVIITDPKILESSILLIKSEIEALRVNLKPIAAQQRMAVSYDKLQLDWMRERADLASAQVKLQQAQSEFKRIEALYKDQIVSQRLYEQAKAAQDSLKGEVDQLDKLVCDGEKNLQMIQLSNRVDAASVSEEPLHAAIATQEAKLRLTEAELSPIVLKATIDGIVTTIYHRSGEAVMAGQPVVAIATFNPVRIVGYMKPPIQNEPQVGMKVEVRTRGLHREVGTGEIKQVGTQLEAMPATMLGPIKLVSSELGLPIDITLPPNLKLRAGELVDLVLQPKSE